MRWQTASAHFSIIIGCNELQSLDLRPSSASPHSGTRSRTLWYGNVLPRVTPFRICPTSTQAPLNSFRKLHNHVRKTYDSYIRRLILPSCRGKCWRSLAEARKPTTLLNLNSHVPNAAASDMLVTSAGQRRTDVMANDLSAVHARQRGRHANMDLRNQGEP